MGIFRSGQASDTKRVLDIPVGDISPNPNQPRTSFSPQSLRALADSIRLHGVLQPLTVRRAAGGWQLVAGERRLRAAKLAGLATVPCLPAAVDEEGSSLLALVENLQRRDLDFLEEALALSQLTAAYGLTQEDIARRLGMSQPAVANKLRLLRLNPDALTLLRARGFTERHARALLRLPDDGSQLSAAQYIVRHSLTVKGAEDYVARLLSPPPKAAKVSLRDVRLFLNSLNKNLRLVQSAGIPAQCRREETDSEIRVTITLPKTVSRRAGSGKAPVAPSQARGSGALSRPDAKGIDEQCFM